MCPLGDVVSPYMADTKSAYPLESYTKDPNTLADSKK